MFITYGLYLTTARYILHTAFVFMSTFRSVCLIYVSFFFCFVLFCFVLFFFIFIFILIKISHINSLRQIHLFFRTFLSGVAYKSVFYGTLFSGSSIVFQHQKQKLRFSFPHWWPYIHFYLYNHPVKLKKLTIYYGDFKNVSAQFLPLRTVRKGSALSKSLFILDLEQVIAQFRKLVYFLHIYSSNR